MIEYKIRAKLKNEIVHKIRVKKLVGAHFRGKYFELKIECIDENIKFLCPSGCSDLRNCGFKRDLRNMPREKSLSCTIVLLNVKNIAKQPLNFCTSGTYCKAIDSMGTLYQTSFLDSFSQRFCWAHMPNDFSCWVSQQYGHSYATRTEIPDGAVARFVLYFPPIPKGSRIVGLIFKCGGYARGEVLETFDFRVNEQTNRKSNLKDSTSHRREFTEGSAEIAPAEQPKSYSFSKIEVDFLMSMRCWVFPFCYVPPDPKKCLRIIAARFNCDKCSYRVKSQDKANALYGLYQKLMREKAEKHNNFVKSKRWINEIRPKILKYDNYTCLICKKQLDDKYAHVHHILDFSGDEDLSPRNLVTLCKDCHSKLHPVFPQGMWRLGWPDMDEVKEKLKEFFMLVRRITDKNKDRLRAPLEHLMMHLCLICPLLKECDMGKFVFNDISTNMAGWENLILVRNRYHICELRDGMGNVTVEGKIILISDPVEVETRYGRTRLVVATLEDDTGKIVLNLFGEQIQKVKLGDYIRVESGYVKTYEGKLTLNVPRKRGRIVVNPEFSIPFYPRKLGRIGREVEATCEKCGSKFKYIYRGGMLRKYCDNCNPSGKSLKKGVTVKVTCAKCGASFSYTYLKGPLRKYCDECRQKDTKKRVEKARLKKRIRELYLQGIRPYKIAEILGIKRNTLNYWLNKLFPDRQKWKRR